MRTFIMKKKPQLITIYFYPGFKRFRLSKYQVTWTGSRQGTIFPVHSRIRFNTRCYIVSWCIIYRTIPALWLLLTDIKRHGRQRDGDTLCTAYLQPVFDGQCYTVVRILLVCRTRQFNQAVRQCIAIINSISLTLSWSD